MKEIIYLDKDYIINEYEKTHNKAEIKYTKSTTVQAGINVGASLGGTLSESFEYDIRVQDMWTECKQEIDKIDKCIRLDDLHSNKCLDIFWIEGLFGIGEVSTSRSGKIIDSYYTYILGQENCNCDKQLDIVLDSSYFTSGYNQLLNSGNSSISGFKIKAKMLMKILGTLDNNKYILTPLVIEKTGYYFTEDK
jgi:pectate lyase